MIIDLKKYNNLDRFVRNGKECIFDKTKKILRIATPEEEIRQRVIEFLHIEMLIPYKAIETEIPVSYFVKGEKGRMDIVIYGLLERKKCPVMVIECKAAEVSLTEDVYIQAKRYSEIVDIPMLMVTNGKEADILSWNYEKEKYEIIEYFPNYDELCNPDKLERIEIEEVPYLRYEYKDLFKKETITWELEQADYLGGNCDKLIAPHIINIAECLMDTSHKIESLELVDYRFIKDGGIRYTSFGNSSGGSYTGLYRYFIVEDKKGNTQIVSITVMGCLNGRSLLIVAVDDMDKHHNSLQLSIEHYSVIVDKKLKLWHDGTLTVGNKGKVKKQEVIDYIQKNSALNVIGSQIQLGEINLSNLLYADNREMKALIANLIEYALVRDEYRKSNNN